MVPHALSKRLLQTGLPHDGPRLEAGVTVGDLHDR